MDECKPLVHGMWEMAVKREHLADFPPEAFEQIVAGRGFRSSTSQLNLCCLSLKPPIVTHKKCSR